jgi:ribosomal protein L19E
MRLVPTVRGLLSGDAYIIERADVSDIIAADKVAIPRKKRRARRRRRLTVLSTDRHRFTGEREADPFVALARLATALGYRLELRAVRRNRRVLPDSRP